MAVSPESIETRSPATGAELPPLCVDLDGTLIFSDLLFESLLLLIKRSPLYLLWLPLWLLRGIAVLKAEIAVRVELNPVALPYDREFLEWLAVERDAGRRLWLCTSCNDLLAARVSSHLGLFEGVLASNRSVNLTGQAKAACLIERFGATGFDYCGSERQDIPVWKVARAAIVVHGARGQGQQAAQHVPVLKEFPSRVNRLGALFRALRPHQWAKNALLLVPLLAAHRASELSALFAGLLAFIAFCLCASSVYVLNDLLDLEADRANPRKSKRPFAAGELQLATGCLLAPILLGLAFGVATFLPASFVVVLGGYYMLTLAYSFGLKGLILIDALTLACLYTLRIIAGSVAVSVPLSFWMLLFSVFLFLSLALVKRFAELEALRRQNKLQAIGRGYEVRDLPILQSLGSAAGYLSVLVLALYINSPEIEPLYHRPRAVWAFCVLLLYWISRVWMTAQRGAMHDDPVVFALKDRVSRVVGLLAMVTFAVAL